jgi:hypothetical protein
MESVPHASVFERGHLGCRQPQAEAQLYIPHLSPIIEAALSQRFSTANERF